MKTRKLSKYETGEWTRNDKPHHTSTPWKLDKDGKTMFIDQPPMMGLPTRLVIGTAYDGNAAFIVRAVNARQRHIEALVRIKNLCEKQIVENPMGKTISPEIHALVMKALDSYDVQDALSEGK